MTSKKAAICCLALVGLLIGVVTALQIGISSKSGPDLQESLAQPQTAMRLHLYAAGNVDPKNKDRQLSAGYDLNGADGKTRVLTRNEFVSGAVETIHYRSDETKSWSREFYPPPADGSPARQRSLAWFSDDGKLYIAHEVRRENGLWERHGQLLADGNYQQTYYCKDGKTVEKVQLFDKEKRFLTEQAIFCETGKNVREMTDGEFGKKSLTLYNAAGKPTAVMTKQDNYETVDYGGDALDANGEVTMHFKHSSGRSGLYSHYLIFKNGNPAVEWEGYDAYGMKVKVYDTSDGAKRVRFEQAYKPKGYPYKEGILQRVTEYAADGKTVLRTIEFTPEGVPSSITLPGADDSSTLIYTLDAAGKNVVKSVLHVSGRKDDQEQPLPANSSVKFPEEFKKTFTHPDEPEWDDGSTNVGNRLYDFP